MAHLGLTPQSVNVLGGYRVQGRGEDGDRLLHDAKVLEAAGAFSVVLEGVPAELAARITDAVNIPTIGIGAGPGCDAQVLVWQDMAGLPRARRSSSSATPTWPGSSARPPVRSRKVVAGQFPAPEHSTADLAGRERHSRPRCAAGLAARRGPSWRPELPIRAHIPIPGT